MTLHVQNGKQDALSGNFSQQLPLNCSKDTLELGLDSGGAGQETACPVGYFAH